ncbi:hypothetical protein CEE34_08820 [Candidatus Aerophobetes bacterium Ae_b3a]|nr:MAG: hypothetical protein CEE34_08820 [Candidatus Aerophobetes bacterium Ae_b3a]
MFRKISVILLFLIFFSLYFWIGLQAQRAGFISQNNLFYAEKALLAIKGDPPRLENAGLVYPPLSSLMTFLPSYPFTGGALIGALLSTLLMVWLGRAPHVSPITKVLFLIILLTSFPVLFLVTQKPAIVLFFTLFTLANLLLLQFHQLRYTQRLFLFGITYGLCFLAGYESMFLLPYYVVICLSIIGLKNRGYFLSTALVITIPALFFFAAWIYLNWIFTGDPLRFLHSPYSYFLALRGFTPFMAQTKRQIFASLSFVLIWSLPFALFYYFSLPFAGKKGRLVGIGPSTLIYLAPFCLLLLEVYLGLFHPSVFRLSLFLFFAAIFIPQIRQRIVQKIIPLLLVVALVWGWWAAWKSPDREEQLFARIVLGSEVISLVAPYQEIVNIVSKTKEKVLLDDAQLYSIVALDGVPQRYILPYNYEFGSALSQPSLFVEYVVVYADPNKDRIAGAWPQVIDGHLPGFYPVLIQGDVSVFRRR